MAYGKSEDLHRRAMAKVLQEISDTMDAEDARRLRGELGAASDGDSEEPIDIDNLDVDQEEGELEGGHPGQLAATDVDAAEGGSLTSPPGGEGSDEEAIADASAELDRAAASPGGDTRPDNIGDRRPRRRRRFGR